MEEEEILNKWPQNDWLIFAGINKTKLNPHLMLYINVDSRLIKEYKVISKLIKSNKQSWQSFGNLSLDYWNLTSNSLSPMF